MIKKTAAAILLAGWAGALWAEGEMSPVEKFQSANAAYQAARYDSALELYQSIVHQGLASPSLYFNLGNAWYRLNRPGPARLWYERALRLNPGNADIRHNLAFLRELWEEDPPDLWEELALRHTSLWAMALVFNLVFFVLLGMSLFWENEPLWWGRWVAGTCLAIGLAVAVAGEGAASRPDGVVLESKTEARAGPGEGEPVSFVVPEGRRVRVFGSQQGWTAVGVPEQALKGWVPSSAVEAIDQ